MKRAGAVVVEIGIPWSEAEFFEQAKRAEHPFAKGYPLRQWTAAAVARVLSHGPSGLRAHQKAALQKWRLAAAVLEVRERELHKQLPTDVECVVKDEKLLLFIDILKEIGYEDVEAAKLMVVGFTVLGGLGDSLAFPPRAGTARDSVRDLIDRAPEAQATAARVRPSGDKELDEAVYAATLKEVEEAGVLKGPATAAELDRSMASGGCRRGASGSGRGRRSGRPMTSLSLGITPR